MTSRPIGHAVDLGLASYSPPISSLGEAYVMLLNHQYTSLALASVHWMRSDIPDEERIKWRTLRLYCLMCNCKASSIDTELQFPFETMFAFHAPFALQLIWAMNPILLCTTPQGTPQSPIPSTPHIDFNFGLNRTIDRLYTLFEIYRLTGWMMTDKSMSLDDVISNESKMLSQRTAGAWGHISMSERNYDGQSPSDSPSENMVGIVTKDLARDTIVNSLIGSDRGKGISCQELKRRLEWILHALCRLIIQYRNDDGEFARTLCTKLNVLTSKMEGCNLISSKNEDASESIIFKELEFFQSVQSGDFLTAHNCLQSLLQLVKNNEDSRNAVSVLKSILSCAQNDLPSAKGMLEPLVDELVDKRKVEARELDGAVVSHNLAVTCLHTLDLTNAFQLLQNPVWLLETSKSFVQPFIVRTLSTFYEFSSQKSIAVGSLQDLLRAGVPEDEGVLWTAN